MITSPVDIWRGFPVYNFLQLFVVHYGVCVYVCACVKFRYLLRLSHHGCLEAIKKWLFEMFTDGTLATLLMPRCTIKAYYCLYT